MLYTPEEFKELKEVMDSIGAYLPENLTSFIWNNYKKISGDHGPQPCSCPSAGGHWKAAVDTIRSYVNDNIDAYKD